MRLRDFFKKDLRQEVEPAIVVLSTTTPQETDTEMNIQSLFDDYETDYEDDLDEFEQDWNPVPHNSLVLNTRVIADGASTVAEVADMLRIYADYLEGLAEDGYELHQSIQSGNGYAYLPEVETE